MKILALTALACVSLIGFAQHQDKHPHTGEVIPNYTIDAFGRQTLIPNDRVDNVPVSENHPEAENHGVSDQAGVLLHPSPEFRTNHPIASRDF